MWLYRRSRGSCEADGSRIENPGRHCRSSLVPTCHDTPLFFAQYPRWPEGLHDVHLRHASRQLHILQSVAPGDRAVPRRVPTRLSCERKVSEAEDEICWAGASELFAVRLLVQ